MENFVIGGLKMWREYLEKRVALGGGCAKKINVILNRKNNLL